VASDNQVDFEFFHSLLNYRFTKNVADSSVIITPFARFDVE